MKAKYYLVFGDANKTKAWGVLAVKHRNRGIHHEYRINPNVVEWTVAHGRVTSVRCDSDVALIKSQGLRYETIDIGVPENCVTPHFLHRRCKPIGGQELGAVLMVSNCSRLVEWLQPELYTECPIGNIYHPDYPAS